MIKLTFCLTRQPHLSRAEFQDYWRNHHAPLVKSFQDALKIKRYVQVHALADELSLPLRGPRGAPDGYDGIAELWWEKIEDMASDDPQARKAGRALLEDEKKFIDLAKSPLWLSIEHEIINRM
ncbi:MAG: EthD domain-containing protein [Alphaproteobacteria bacterium]|nr:EthD domain-containing protein [Alphaproteobacteria bacterium]